jgi:uncharacterized membrane protein
LKKIIRQAAAKLSGIFLRGLAITLPITLTGALVYWLAMLAEDSLGGLIRFLFPDWRYWPGMGIVAALAIVLLAGALMSVWLTRRAMFFVDGLLDRIPLVKSVYGSLRDIAMFLSKKDSKSRFKKVVAVRFAEEIRLIGFVTIEDFAGLAAGGKGKDQAPVGVYLPMSYQIGGYMVFVPKTLIEPLDMPVEDATRFILTAGVSGGKANGKTTAE